MNLWFVSVALCCATVVYGCDVKTSEVKLNPEDGASAEIVLEDVTTITVASDVREYVDVVIVKDESKATVTLKNMKEYHKLIKSTGNLHVMDLKLNLVCEDKSTTEKDFKISLNFYNKFDPELIEPKSPVIKYNLPMPFPPTVQLTCIQKIVVADWDIYNTDLEVASDNDNFEITKKKIDGDLDKTFEVFIEAKNAIESEITFNMVLTDKTGGISDVRTKNIPIHIVSDKDNSMVILDKTKYTGDFYIDLKPSEFKVTAEVTPKEANVKITEDNSACFEVHNTEGNVEIVSSLNNGCKLPFDKDFLNLELVATNNDKTVSAALLVNIHKKKFEKPIYTGEIKDGVLGPLEPINLNGATLDTQIKMDPADSKLACTRKGDNCPEGVCEIECTYKGGFEDSVLKAKIVAMTDGTEESKESTQLIINLSETIPEFTQIHYEGTFDNKDKIELVNNKDIETLQPCKGLKLESSDSRFEVNCEADNKVILTVKKSVSPIKELYVTTELTATKGSKSGHATIVLKVLQDDEVGTIKFSQDVYESTIDETGLITSNPEVELEDIDCEGLEFKFSDTKFSTKCNDKKLTITATGWVPPSDDAHVTLTLTAENSEKTKTGKTIIVINLPKTSEPPTSTIKFTQDVYESTIDETGLITSNPEVELEDMDCDGLGFKFSDTKFSANCNNKKLTITGTGWVPPSEDTHVTLTLTAENSEKTKTGKTIIVINLPKTSEPPTSTIKFTQDVYESTIDETGLITSNPEVELEDMDCDGLGFKFSDTKFSANCNNKKLTITGTGWVPPSEDTHVTLTLTAENSDKTKSGKTIIVINLPKTSEPPTSTIKFTQDVYESTIDETGLITSNPEVELEDMDCDGLGFKFSDTKFSANCNNKKLTITGTGWVPPSEDTHVTLTLTAENSEKTKTGKTIIVINLPKTSEPPTSTIKFTQDVYESTIDETGLITSNPEVELEDMDCDGLGFKFSDTKFSANCNNKKLTITGTGWVPPSDDTHVTLTLTAENSDKTKSGKTIIVINLPKTSEPPTSTIKFTQDVYESTIDETGLITSNPEVELEDMDCDGLGFKFSDTKFSANCNNKKLTITGTGWVPPSEDTHVTLTLTAENSEKTKTGKTIIVINLPKTSEPPTSTIKFTQDVYESTIDETGLITSNPEVELEDMDCDGLGFKFSDTKFSANCNNKKLTITGTGWVPPSDDTHVTLTLTAENSDKTKSGKTIIVINLPKTSEPPTSTIKFTQDVYESTIDETGLITSNPEVELEDMDCDGLDFKFSDTKFSANCNNKKLTITGTGWVPPSDDTHVSLILTAQNADKTKTGKTIIILAIPSTIPSPEPSATYSHMIITLDENQDKPQTVIKKPSDEPDYGYCFENAVPKISGVFENKDGDVICNKFQREAPQMSDFKLHEPQFLVTVELKKLENGKCPEKRRYKRDHGLTEGIAMKNVTEMNPQRTTITVLINDDNNNSPVIDEPTRTVGYPNKELVEFIRPPYLTKVHATDKDSPDKFGKITYSSESPTYIEVNSETGEVYTTNAIYDDNKKEYTVKACDEGDEETPQRCDTAKITIKVLEEEQIATIEIPAKIEKIDEWLKEQSDDNIMLRLLSVVGMYENAPNTMLNPFLRADTTEVPNRITTAVIYALDKEKETPLNAAEIKERLKDVADIEVMEYETATDRCPTSKEEEDDVGLIVAVSLLSVILAGVLVAGGIYYYRTKKSKSVPYKSDFPR